MATFLYNSITCYAICGILSYSRLPRNKKRPIPSIRIGRNDITIVELEGFEPSSEQGNHTLSTCLFQPLVFVHRQDLNHQPMPYPLKFHERHEADAHYLRRNCTAKPT